MAGRPAYNSYSGNLWSYQPPHTSAQPVLDPASQHIAIEPGFLDEHPTTYPAASTSAPSIAPSTTIRSSRARGVEDEEKKYYCPLCYQQFQDPRARNKHLDKPICSQKAVARNLPVPTQDDIARSKNKERNAHLKDISDMWASKEGKRGRRPGAKPRAAIASGSSTSQPTTRSQPRRAIARPSPPPSLIPGTGGVYDEQHDFLPDDRFSQPHWPQYTPSTESSAGFSSYPSTSSIPSQISQSAYEFPDINAYNHAYNSTSFESVPAQSAYMLPYTDALYNNSASAQISQTPYTELRNGALYNTFTPFNNIPASAFQPNARASYFVSQQPQNQLARATENYDNLDFDSTSIPLLPTHGATSATPLFHLHTRPLHPIPLVVPSTRGRLRTPVAVAPNAHHF
ncbi:hypothetical protein C8F01DRAFT_1360760 [Mycena amicta]|nr:hypothetical protein C8F01DRAFT_1360760 [Mycena amicta]